MLRQLSIPTLLIVLLAACGGSNSPEALCKHLAKVAPKGQAKDQSKCVSKMKEMKEQMGDEAYNKFAKCAMGTKKPEDMLQCAGELGGVEAFDRYKKKSQGTEALVMLKRLYDGVRVYSMDGQMNVESLDMAPSGPALPKESTGIVPPLGSCCKNGDKCAPDAQAWEHPTFVQLDFGIFDPHYYSYEYKRESDTKFTVSAYGDLDCDGEYSTFSMSGTLGPDGEITGGEMQKTKPTE